MKIKKKKRKNAESKADKVATENMAAASTEKGTLQSREDNHKLMLNLLEGAFQYFHLNFRILNLRMGTDYALMHFVPWSTFTSILPRYYISLISDFKNYYYFPKV